MHSVAEEAETQGGHGGDMEALTSKTSVFFRCRMSS